ncbi:ABC transporter ATP-binding protein [Dokdonia pacifica]|uniref:ABC-type bacteriocin/lantibiotic exporter, contains an N-terminal double-glycine peptidase domain n=1 Tax=Dokdonia pacifica TaxID=1627892 RepID=A0A239C0V6_9FLAO|nr:ABC transporter ATP-binding protein [Dokdonia pacifica]GGG27311.1 ABC transporter ATP-binding protein [Dokdonia pacifica]SNS13013.1 ABC-type bacteriocin/lantibiotic exporter, contains an N-terminal double-glycine peptidase domain [Dokdonia pacifica]
MSIFLKRVNAIIPNSYRKTIVFFFLLSILLLILDIFSVFLLIPLIVSLIDTTQATQFIPIDFLKDNTYALLTIVFVFFILKNYLSIKINNYQSKVAYQLGSEYSVLLSKHYLLGNYLSFKKQKTSSIVKEVIFIANEFVNNVALGIITLFSELSLLIIVISIGLYFYFKISLLIIIVLTIITISIRLYNKKVIEDINKTRSKDYDDNISNLTNLLNGYISIKSPELLNHFLETFSKSNRKLNTNYAVLNAKKLNTSRQTEIIIVTLICLIFLYLNVVSSKEINAVVFLSVFGTLLFKAIPSLNRLNIALTNINAHKYTLDILEQKLSIISKKKTTTTTIAFDKTIVLKNISFSYENDNKLLTSINLTLNKGDFITIEGDSGKGKTTLLNIISKLIDADSGQILLDNIEITDDNKHNYFSLITYLTQRPFIFEGTILQNLILDDVSHNQNEIKYILNKLEILDVIESLPNGINHFIGVQGSNLSGGQLQRLCIARALLYKPEILILDEATNNLDRDIELKTLAFIKEYTSENNTTIILVSHHLNEKQNIQTTRFNLNTHHEV